MSSPELDHHRERRSSSLNRNSGRYKMQYDDYGNRNYNNSRDRSDKSQVIASGFPPEVLDHEVKEALVHEMEKFGDIVTIQLRGREQHRQAFITFRDDEAARELRRYCLERHCKVLAFQRTLHFDFELGDTREYNRDRGYNNHSNRGSFNHRNTYNKPDYRNDRYNGRNDYENRERGYNNQNRDRFNNENHINPRATRTLFVGNLEHDITKEELMRIFEHWGAIDDIDVKRPPNGIPAYAFIKYLELEAAASAKNQMFGKEINGRPIKVGYGKTLPSTRLWIGGLGQWCTAEMLNREFDRFGALRKIDYVKGSRHAFIEFESLDASSAAHAEMRGFPLGGPDRKIKIDYAEVNNRHADERDKNFDNRSDDGRYNNDYSRSSNRYENKYENQGNFNRGRGRGNFDNHGYNRRNDYGRDNNDRVDRRRSRSPVISERSESRRRTPSESRGVSPPRTRNENSPGGRTRNDSSGSKELEKTGNGTHSDQNESDSKPSENLGDVSKRFVVAWRGAFALKNSAFPVRMHLIGGNPELANFYLRGMGVGAGPAIKILSVTQRLRLDPPKLDEVSRRIQQVGAGGHCILLALPTGDDIELDSSFQRRPLKSLVTYFTKKEAAGVIILNTEGPSGKQEESGMLHAFPPCEFSQQQLIKVAPNLGSEPSKEDHLVVIVVKGTTS